MYDIYLNLEYLKEIENNELQNTPELSWNVTKNFLIHIINNHKHRSIMKYQQ